MPSTVLWRGWGSLHQLFCRLLTCLSVRCLWETPAAGQSRRYVAVPSSKLVLLFSAQFPIKQPLARASLTWPACTQNKASRDAAMSRPQGAEATRLGKMAQQRDDVWSRAAWGWINGYTVMHIWLPLVFWVIAVQRVPMIVFWCCQLLKFPYLLSLKDYIRTKERTPSYDVNKVASFKFFLLIFLWAHYIGLLFYFLCILVGFDTNLETQSWVIQFGVYSGLQINTHEILVLSDYLLCMYKGLNTLTQLGFEGTVPRRMEELIFALITYFVQLVVEAYILGARPKLARLGFHEAA